MTHSYFTKSKKLFSKPHFTTSWRLHYEAEINDGVDSMKLAKQIPGYYSIFSDQNQWINYGCVSLGTYNVWIRIKGKLVLCCLFQ